MSESLGAASERNFCDHSPTLAPTSKTTRGDLLFRMKFSSTAYSPFAAGSSLLSPLASLSRNEPRRRRRSRDRVALKSQRNVPFRKLLDMRVFLPPGAAFRHRQR